MSDENAGSASASFAQALSHAVAERGLSLEEVRRALDRVGYGVTTTTLSYWQSGRSMPRRADSTGRPPTRTAHPPC